MVDNLLASHMEDLGISPEQFENACLEAKENLGSRLHSVLFEQCRLRNHLKKDKVLKLVFLTKN